MTLLEIKNHIMHQTNNDADDLGDFLPYLVTYINEGYDKAAMAWAGEHSSQESDTYTPLRNDKSRPEVPDWMHQAIADWATWLVYRNGNIQKQNRGLQYRNAAESVFAQARGMADSEKGISHGTTRAGQYFTNIPR